MTRTGQVWVVRHAGSGNQELLRIKALPGAPTVYCIPPCVHPTVLDGMTRTTVAYRNNSGTHPAAVFWRPPSEEGDHNLVEMLVVPPGGRVAVLDSVVGHSFVAVDRGGAR